MWFDVRAKLAEIEGRPPATSATTATQAPAARPVSQMSQVSQRPEAQKPAFRVASVASVATPPPAKSQPAPRADGLDPDADAGAYLDRLHLHGPATYGAMASAMGWGATRAWRAEAKLRALGLVTMGELGRAVPVKQARKVRVLNAKETGRNVPGAVYCGRPGPWGNPFRIGKDGNRAEVVAKFREWLMAQPDLVAKARAELRGRDLVCWCAPLACHCDVLAEVANAEERGNP